MSLGLLHPEEFAMTQKKVIFSGVGRDCHPAVKELETVRVSGK